jgi:flagellum-specific ATP synthase
VLVEGDDMNEPISDTVRGILDGHIVLSRALATNNHYPAIDVLESISRVMKDIVPKEQYEQASYIKSVMATYKSAKDLIDIGAYKMGSSAEIDKAIKMNPKINQFLCQNVDEVTTYEKVKNELSSLEKL